jgi:hypothetical protein
MLSFPALAQGNATAAARGISGCSDRKAKFEVKPSTGKSPAQPEQGKALVYFVGSSWFYFSVDPGVHHLCAATHFGMSSNATAVVHFTAEPGGTYYFEMKNLSWPGDGVHDVSLFPLDSDEGKFLTTSYQLVASRQKK